MLLPVRIADGMRGIGMTVPMAREWAQAILDATSPAAVSKTGPRPQPATTEAPVLKPGGNIL